MLLPFGEKLRACGQVLLSLTAISSEVVSFPLRPSPRLRLRLSCQNPMASQGKPRGPKTMP